MRDHVNILGYCTWSRTCRDINSGVAKTYKANVYSDVEKIEEIFSDERDVINVLRWECRGMTLYDAIKKALNQKEVAEYCSK